MSCKKNKGDKVQLSFSISPKEKQILIDYAEQTRRSMTKVLRDYIYIIGKELHHEDKV